MTEALASGRPLYLLHTTRDIAAIRTSGELHVSTGSLVGALYCSPLTRQREGWRPHNFGAYLMRTKPSTTLMIFEVVPDAPIPPGRGLSAPRRHPPAHLPALSEPPHQAENDRLDHAVRAGLGAAAMFLDMALRNAAGGAGLPTSSTSWAPLCPPCRSSATCTSRCWPRT